MMPIIYGFSFVISVVVLIVVLVRRKVYDVYHIMLAVTIPFCNFGYLMASLSKSLGEMILATKILYLGCFLPFFLFMVISKICRISIPKYITIPMAVYAGFIYTCVLTIGYSDIYYKTAELRFENGGAMLVRTYGFAHTLYSLMIYAYMAATIIVILISFNRKKIVSHTTVTWLCVLMITTCATFGLQKLLPVSVEFMPIIYAANCAVLVYWLEKSDMYDVTVSLIRAREKDNRIGYIVFDRNKQYCGADEMVKEIYPEISNLYIDKPVPQSETEFYKSVALWFLENADSDTEPSKVIQIGNNFYRISLLNIRYGKKNRLSGYLIEFTDVTAEQLYILMLDDYNEKLEKDVREKTESILDIQNKIIIGIATIVESRDSSTGSHIKRTSAVVSIFAEKLKETGDFSEDFLKNVIKAAPMHDIGKVSVDDKVLRKKGKYTEEEYAQMQKHSRAGAEIVGQILGGVETPDLVDIAVNVAHYHHEKWNGSGYPCGLASTEIPVEARIMALADVFDALVSKRCYKDAYSYDEAFDIIRNSLGTHFDPQLGELFIKCRDDLVKYYDANAAE